MRKLLLASLLFGLFASESLACMPAQYAGEIEVDIYRVKKIDERGVRIDYELKNPFNVDMCFIKENLTHYSSTSIKNRFVRLETSHPIQKPSSIYRLKSKQSARFSIAFTYDKDYVIPSTPQIANAPHLTSCATGDDFLAILPTDVDFKGGETHELIVGIGFEAYDCRALLDPNHLMVDPSKNQYLHQFFDPQERSKYTKYPRGARYRASSTKAIKAKLSPSFEIVK